MEQLKQVQREVLLELKGMLDSLDIVNVLREPEGNLPMPVLTTIHSNIGYQGNEVMGEFYFLPLFAEKQDFHYFTVVMTLDEQVSSEKQEEMAKAANMLNYYLPMGAFVAEKDGGVLAYKHAGLLPVSLDTKMLSFMADGMIGTAMSMVNEYVDPLMQLLNGQITLAEFELELPDVE